MSTELTRREFFINMVKALRGRSVCTFAQPQSASPRQVAWIRPPGAKPEPQFLSACTRCRDCIEACPYDSIRRLGPEFGDAAGTPAIIVNQSPCYLCEDMPCAGACQPQALDMTALADVRMATASIRRNMCYQAQGQPCDYCTARCPIGESAIDMGEDGIPIIDRDHCAGCGVCAYLCPAGAVMMLRPEVNEA